MKSSHSELLKFLGFQPTGDLGPWTIYTAADGGIVAFPRSPPLRPPTYWQLRQRQRFAAAALSWQLVGPEARAAWEAVTHAASLRVTGYNLFVWYLLRQDAACIRTLENQTGIDLLPLSVPLP